MNQKMAQQIIEEIVNLGEYPPKSTRFATIIGTMRLAPHSLAEMEDLGRCGALFKRQGAGNKLASSFLTTFQNHYEPLVKRDKKHWLEMTDVFPVNVSEYGIHRPILTIVLNEENVEVVDFNCSPAEAAKSFIKRFEETGRPTAQQLENYYVWVLTWNKRDIEHSSIWSRNIHDYVSVQLTNKT